MDPLTPTRTTTTVARGNALAFLGSFLTVVVGMTTATKSPTWIMVMSIGCLLFGWLLVATIIAHATSEKGMLCEEPNIRREFHAMSSVPIVVRLQNPSNRWPLLFVTSELLMACDGHLLNSPPKFVGQLPIRSAAEFDWRITPRRRGEVELRGLVARTSFPGSLLTREYFFVFDCSFLALPAIYLLKPKVDQLLSGRRYAAGHRPSNPAAMEEFVGVRAYRPGDNPRNVCISHSLRMPDYPWQLVVREFEDLSDEEICVVLDTFVPSSESDDHALMLYRFEKSISFAVALCRQLADLKHKVRFMACRPFGEPIALHIRQPLRDLPVMERTLARLEPVRDPNACQRLLQRQEKLSDAILLCVSLRETPVRSLGRSEGAVQIDPEWQSSLVSEVAAV